MANTLPAFRVIVMQDGRRFGVILFRRPHPAAPWSKQYFTLSDPKQGLWPAPARVRQHCEECHRLKMTLSHDRFLCEIRDYASRVEAAVGEFPPLPLTQEYHERREYPEALGTLFRRDKNEAEGFVSPLAAFIGRPQFFRKGILYKPKDKDEVVGKALEFRVVPPDATGVFVEELDVLEPADVLLQFSKPAQWFRPDGPVFQDFKHGLIRRRLVTDDIKERLQSGCVCAVTGERASGKTAVARMVAYELCDNLPVYHMRWQRGLCPSKIAKEINSVYGLVIIEDVHRDMRGFKEVWRRTKVLNDRRLLVTAIPSPFGFKDDFAIELDQAIVKLDTVGDAPGILEHLEEHHGRISPASKRAILQASGSNLWNLIYAYQGCLKARGEGEPAAWMRDGARADLDRLYEASREMVRTLLGLCALSRVEAPVAEEYVLEYLQCSEDAIRELVRLGEIVTVKDEGAVYYMVSHPVRAAACWEAGADYRASFRLPGLRESLHDYGVSAPPNGLRAFLCSQEAAKRLWATMSRQAQARLLKSERDFEALWDWIGVAGLFENRLAIGTTARRLNETPDAGALYDCLWMIGKYTTGGARRRVGRLLNISEIAPRMVQAGDSELVLAMVELLSEFGSAGGRLCEHVGTSWFARQVACAGNAEDAVWCLSLVYHTSKRMGRRVWKSMNQAQFRELIAGYPNAQREISSIEQCCETSKSLGRNVWEMVDRERLFEQLLEEGGLRSVVEGVATLYVADKNVGRGLWAIIRSRLRHSLDRQIWRAIEEREAARGIIFLWDMLRRLPGTPGIGRLACQGYWRAKWKERYS